MERKIILLSHCILNDYSKIKRKNSKRVENEDNLAMEFLNFLLEENIAIIQLPCPEYIIYGPNRWGHTSNQFDNSMYIEASKELFKPFKMQIMDYLKDGVNILGIVGIKGSPSCGVNLTSEGDWGGGLASNEKLEDTLASISYKNKAGIFIREISKDLKKEGIDLDFFEYDSKDISQLKSDILTKLKS